MTHNNIVINNTDVENLQRLESALSTIEGLYSYFNLRKLEVMSVSSIDLLKMPESQVSYYNNVRSNLIELDCVLNNMRKKEQLSTVITFLYNLYKVDNTTEN